MNAQVHFIAPQLPDFKVDAANDTKFKDGFVEFYLEYGCEYLGLKIQVNEHHDREYRDMNKSPDPQRYNPAGHWVIKLTDSRLVEVIEKSSDFIRVGKFLTLTLAQVTDLQGEIDALNERRFEQMIKEFEY